MNTEYLWGLAVGIPIGFSVGFQVGLWWVRRLDRKDKGND